MQNKPTIIILAGGKSTRMGEDKGLILIEKKPMVQHVIDVAEKISNEIIIISNNIEYKQFGLPVYEDIMVNCGPLAGIYTGLKNSKTTENIILTCDSPFVSLEIIELLLDNAENKDIVYPYLEGKAYPLTALYNVNTLTIIKKQLDNFNFRVKDLLDLTNSFKIELNQSFARNMKNINTPSDL